MARSIGQGCGAVAPSVRSGEQVPDRQKTPEYQVRFRWTPYAIVFWDNRATQHYATLDYWPQERIVERVTIIGGAPY